MKRILLFLYLFVCQFVPALGMTSDCLVFNTSKKYMSANSLSNGSKILSLDMKGGFKLVNTSVDLVYKEKASELAVLETEIGKLTVGIDKLFFDPVMSRWVAVKDLTHESCVLTLARKWVRVLGVEILKLEVPVDVYHIDVHAVGNYFIMDSDGNAILTHNGITVAFASVLMKLGFEAAIAKAIAGTTTVVLSTSAKRFLWSTVSAVCPVAALGGGIVYGAYKGAKFLDELFDDMKYGKIRKEAAKAAEKKRLNKRLEEIRGEIWKEEEQGQEEVRQAFLDNTVTGYRNVYVLDSNNKITKVIKSKEPLPSYKVDTSFGKKPPEDPDSDDEGDPEPIDYRKNSVDHIFTEKGSHLKDSKGNRSFFKKIANDKRNFLGSDENGNKWYSKKLLNGKQAYVRVNKNKIISAGVNKVPRTFNSKTGLCNKGKK